jgi:hypothetical protein
MGCVPFRMIHFRLLDGLFRCSLELGIYFKGCTNLILVRTVIL